MEMSSAANKMEETSSPLFEAAPPNPDESSRQEPKRETWAKKIDFLLACMGFSVGLGNVWRFPYLCYKNGGGAFLIPYFISVICGGIPLFFLEVSLGQWMAEGGIGCWNIVPVFRGIGYATTVIVFILNIYYNVILAWSLRYLFSSMAAELPWKHCGNHWNSPCCTENWASLANQSESSGAYNVSALGFTNETICTGPKRDPVIEYWERNVLQLSKGLEEPGTVCWDLALCLLLAWIIVYFCIWKGIKTSGKVMYFTATSPYVFMIILLIRGVTLPGAADGLIFYLKPDFSRLSDMQVWADAGTQIFFSYSISLGTLTALGSYNKFHHNSYRDSLLFAGIDTFTSTLAGCVIFSIIGFMAREQNIPVATVADSGPGLAFVAYPKALAQLPIGPFWAICFFIMLLLLGMDSQFVGVEGFVTAITDEYPKQLRGGRRREIFIAVVCAISFLIGLSMVTNGGMYVFQLFDYYSGSRIILIVGFFECIAVAFVYGVNRHYDNIQYMLGFRPSPVMKVMWCFFTPVFALAIFIVSAISYAELTYNRTYTYPKWGIGIGWCLALASSLWIPAVAIWKLASAKGSLRERWRTVTTAVVKEHQKKKDTEMTSDKLDDETNAIAVAEKHTSGLDDDC